jgi:hypothetical protein
MNLGHLMTILGASLLFSDGNVTVSYARKRGVGPAASETALEKHNLSSKMTDTPSEASAVSRTSEGTRMGKH